MPNEEPTGRLRFIDRQIDPSEHWTRKVLQQEWLVNDVLEWRDVPLVVE